MLTNNYKRVVTVSKIFARNLIIMNVFFLLLDLLFKACPIAGAWLIVIGILAAIFTAVYLFVGKITTKVKDAILPVLGAVALIPALYGLVTDRIIPYYATGKEIFINTSNAYTSIIMANLFVIAMYVLFIVIEIKRKGKTCQAQLKSVEEDQTDTN